MKKSVILTIVITFIFCLEANASQQHLKTFNDWSIFQETKKGVTNCYAINTPYRTRAFVGIRNLPFASISYKGPYQFSISLNAGFAIDHNKGFILIANKRSHRLDVNMRARSYAWTSSSIQDAAIINDMIKDNTFFTVRSYSTNAEVALDYYSLKGLEDALIYMSSNCSK